MKPDFSPIPIAKVHIILQSTNNFGKKIKKCAGRGVDCKENVCFRCKWALKNIEFESLLVRRDLKHGVMTSILGLLGRKHGVLTSILGLSGWKHGVLTSILNCAEWKEEKSDNSVLGIPVGVDVRGIEKP